MRCPLWVERAYPLVIAIAIALMSYFIGFRIASYTSLLEGATTVSSILIGFMGALAGILLSIESKSISYLKRIGKFSLIFSYLLRAIEASFLVVILSFGLQLFSPASQESLSWSLIWIFLASYSLLATFRALVISTSLLKIVSERED